MLIEAPDENDPKYKAWQAEHESVAAALNQACEQRNLCARLVIVGREKAFMALQAAVGMQQKHVPAANVFAELSAAAATEGIDQEAIAACQSFEKARLDLQAAEDKVAELGQKYADISNDFWKHVPPAPLPQRQLTGR